MMKVLSLVNQTKDQCANLRRSANLLLHENKIAYFTRDYSYYTIDNYPPYPRRTLTGFHLDRHQSRTGKVRRTPTEEIQTPGE